jgi:type I restriction enzyme S subunit
VSGWKLGTLGDLVNFKNGKKRPNNSGEYPVYGGNDVLGYADSFNEENIAVVGRVGAFCGSVYYEPTKCWISDNAISAKAVDVANIKYIYYLLRSLNLNSYNIGTSQPLLTQEILNRIIVKIPPLPVQCAIADTLSAFDAKIANNTKINNHLEQMAQAVWDERFGGLGSNGSLGDIIELFDFKRIPLSGNQREKMEKIYPYYGAATLMDYVDNYLFDGIYLLLGEDGTVIDNLGFPTLQYVWGKFWVNNHAHILQGRNGFTVESLYVLLKQTSVTSIVTGAVQPKINQANLKALAVVVPSKEEMQEFNDLITPLFVQIRENRDENAHLAELRDALLPRLMSGELSVAELGDAK